MSRRIYLDLDGVMADFDGTFPSVFGLDHRDMADDDMWLKINGHPSFFRDLPPMNGAVEFFRTIEHLDPIILTACPKSNYAHVATQKVEWVRAHLSAHVTVLPVLGGSSKPLFMHAKGDILIDDYRRNTEAWATAGGDAILHRGFEGTAAALETAIGSYATKPAQPVEAVDVTDEVVERACRAYYNSGVPVQPPVFEAIRAALLSALAHPSPTACACGAECMDTGHGNCRYTAPTGEQAGEVDTGLLYAVQSFIAAYIKKYGRPITGSGNFVSVRGNAPMYDEARNLNEALFKATRAQPRPLGVPDGLEDANNPWRRAIEHAGYLATAAERYMEAEGMVNIAFEQVENVDEPDDEAISELESAQQDVDEQRKAVRDGIYEFTKRRDRALATLAAAPAPGKGGEA